MSLDKIIFKKGIFALCENFKSKTRETLPSEETLRIWHAVLSDMTNESFQTACIYIMRNSKWFPSMSEIREAGQNVDDVCNGNMSTIQEQWDIFKRTVSAYGANKLKRMFASGEQVFEDDVTNHVAEMIFEDFCNSNISESGNWYARFKSAYEQGKTEYKRTKEITSLSSIAAISFKQVKKIK